MTIKKILKNLQKVEDSILVVTFCIMVISFFLQVVNRNIIKQSVSWFEELSRYCMMYMAFLATEAGLRDGTQISVTTVTDKMSEKTRAVVLLIAKTLVVAFSLIIFITSFDLLQIQIRSHQLSPALKIPMYIPYFALTLSFGIIVVTQISLWLAAFFNIIRKSPEVIQKESN
jgi:TRAP-type C4-dicarboxylate transport system permease small subunit